eukprot:gene5609-5847_t
MVTGAAAPVMYGLPLWNQLYQQAVQLIQKDKFEAAFVIAKRALDEATCSYEADSTAVEVQQCYLALAQAAAGMGNTEGINSSSFKADVLIVAGDVGDTAAAVSTTFKLLAARFHRVVWVPGNHELWLRPDTGEERLYADSFAKLMALRQVCSSPDVVDR